MFGKSTYIILTWDGFITSYPVKVEAEDYYFKRYTFHWLVPMVI